MYTELMQLRNNWKQEAAELKSEFERTQNEYIRGELGRLRVCISEVELLLSNQLIKEQQPPLQQAGVISSLPDDSELKDWLFEGDGMTAKNKERLLIGRVVRNNIERKLRERNAI